MPKLSQVRGLKQLLASKQRTTVTNQRGQSTTMTYGAVNASLLTSSTAFNSAAETTGLIKTLSDKIRIKSIRLRGNFEVESSVYSLGTGNVAPRIRQIDVWFYKSDTKADASGNLPSLEEVLEEIDCDTFEKTKTESSAKWAILHDETYLMGISMTSATAVTQDGPMTHSYDILIPVNRSQSYKAPPTSTNPGGHYDSSVNAGQITKGLPMLYTYLEGTNSGWDQPIMMTCNSRVLYQE